MAYTPQQVVSHGFPFDDFEFTYNLAAGITAADVGKAVTLDNTGPAKFKLAGNGNPIHGYLKTVEDRTVSGMLVGTVARKFKSKLKAVSGHSIAVGEAVCGSSTAGIVREAVAGTDPITNVVVEVLPDNFVVVESL